MPMLLGDLLLFFCLAAWVNSFRVGNDLLLSGVFSRQVAEVPVKTTIIDAIEEPAPGAVAVTEYEVRTATSILPGAEPERGEGIGPAGTST
jgi:hypothetical protein